MRDTKEQVKKNRAFTFLSTSTFLFLSPSLSLALFLLSPCNYRFVHLSVRLLSVVCLFVDFL